MRVSATALCLSLPAFVRIYATAMLDPSRIWSSPNLPTLPAAAVRLLELSRNPEAELHDVITTVKSDPATCARLLKSANSSYFGFAHQVTGIERAVTLLGTTVVTSLTLSFSLADACRSGGQFADYFASCWRQSAAQAAAAETLAEMTGEGIDSDYFLAGLLIDLGRLAMLRTIPKEYLPIMEAAEGEAEELHLVELSQLGFDHVTVGTRLMQQWNLPPAICRAAAFHHGPAEALRGEQTAEDFHLIRGMAVASAVGDYFCRPNKAAALARLRTVTTEFCGFDYVRLNDYLDRVRTRFDDVSNLYAAGSSPLPEPTDLMTQANEQLAHLAVSQHAATAQAVAKQKLAEQQSRELESENERLQQQARHDPLTRLYNRAYFDDALDRELVRAGRSGDTIGLLFCDLDRFKSINDTHGHAFGDLVLRQTGAALSTCLRRSDVLGRFGGEEFVVLVSQPTEAGLAKVAERLRAKIAAEPFVKDGLRIPVTVSIGGALALPGRMTAGIAERLLEEADAAMYDSKHAGRNHVHLRSLLDDTQKRLTKAIAARRFSRWIVTRGVLDIATVSRVLLRCETPRRPIGQIARLRGVLDDLQIERILAETARSGERFGETALRLGLLTEPLLADLLARQQEEPRRLGESFVEEGLCDAARVDALLAAHSAEIAPVALAC